MSALALALELAAPAALWGLARTVALEHPALRPVRIRRRLVAFMPVAASLLVALVGAVMPFFPRNLASVRL